ncbi:Rho GTPase activation protein [Lipomyces kononenkoae]|uniref:Rho GTPase activation protein n=1 Tax=Lipomyces kononenkoae TaxID=34357 RepID=A0ACC3T710_LIPKO
MSQRRNSLFGRPTSMVIDQRTIDGLTDETTAYRKSMFSTRSSVNRKSTSTVSSSISIIVSNSPLSPKSSSSDAPINNKLSITVSASIMSSSSSSSTISSMVDASPEQHSVNQPPEKTRRRDILGRMRSSLDRHRSLPWSRSSKSTSKLSNSEPESEGGLVARTERKNSAQNAFNLKEMKRSASAFFHFNTSTTPSTSISPSSSATYTSSCYSPNSSSPTSSVTSASYPCSLSPVKSYHEDVPATIVEDDVAITEPSSSTTPRMDVATVTSLNPHVPPIPRSRRNNGHRARPQTIVGFFRQSRIFSSPSKSCDVFGMPLRDAVVMSRLDVNRDDNRYWVPVIVTRCISFLNQHGLHEEGLYRVSGSVSGIEELKKEFAFYGQEMVLLPDVHDVHTVASLLKAYIRALPEELIPPSPQLFSILTHISDDVPYEAIQHLIATLPVYNFHLLHILCSHFALVASACGKNRMTLSNLILILCPTMRMDSKLFSWMVEDVDRCLGPVDQSSIRNKEYAAVIDETSIPVDSGPHMGTHRGDRLI